MSDNDVFGGQVGTIESPARHVFIVTPSDSDDLPMATRAIRTDTGGAIKLTTVGGETVVCLFMPGETRAIRAVKIWADGTLADDIEGMA